MDRLTTLLGYFKAGNDAQFAAEYQDYVISTLGWYANEGGGKDITLDCTMGDPEGVMLPTGYDETKRFFFMLRPLALGQGFTYDVVYTVDGQTKTKHVATWENHPAKRQFCMEPGIYKTWTLSTRLQ